MFAVGICAIVKVPISFTLETLQKCINVLEYRRSKPVLRKSRTTYDNLEISIESSLNEVYHAQCYKLFTAIKIPRDYQYVQHQQSVKITIDVNGYIRSWHWRCNNYISKHFWKINN